MDTTKLKFSYKLAIATTCLAFVVVMLGAYTRLKDGGLGCPDWPGCYGHVAVPSVQQLTLEDNAAAKIQPLEAPKAWAEMVHRYFAGTLSLAITTLFIIALYRAKTLQRWLILPCALFALLIFQAILGMWTVTWLLYPLVVMSHLLGGMSIMTLLWIYGIYCSGKLRADAGQSYRVWAVIGLVIVFLQIVLGGWTSSNYAALACPNLPFCQGTWLPDLNFKEAFLAPLHWGPNYQGGLIDMSGRVTIQFLHRLGAVITFAYVLALAISLFFSRNNTLMSLGLVIFILLLIQCVLGVLNVLLQLPLVIAVAHNGVGALLLLTMATLVFSLFCKGSACR